MTHTSFLNARKGFTLVELLVTMAIIGGLLAVLLPSLAAVQATAKASSQASIIQGLGKGFGDFSSGDSQGRFTSSAYDHFRDGDFTVYGWVADLINAKYAIPGKSLDPLNRSKLNEKFTDAIGASASGTFNTNRWQDVNRYSDAVAVASDGSNATGTGYFGTQKGQNVYDRGFNTNFATTWHFVRGDNNVTSTSGAGVYANNASAVDPGKCPLDGDGPISSVHLADTMFITSADKVALLGAARVGDGGDSTINAGASDKNQAISINNYVNDYGTIRKVVAKVGDFTCESFCDGMDATVLTANPLYAANSKVHENNDIIPNCKMKTIAHPSGVKVFGGGFGNVLFADLSTRRVADTGGYGGKGDGWMGAYRDTGLGSTGNYYMNTTSLEECRDEMWLGRLRAVMVPGGGSSEG